MRDQKLVRYEIAWPAAPGRPRALECAAWQARELGEIVEAGWAQALAPVADQIAAMGEFLRAEIAAGRGYLPAGVNVLRAFAQPFGKVRVLVVGQDPYPTPGHAMGLSFSVAPDVTPIPRSLANIYAEYSKDLGFPTPSNGDLSPWAAQGVLMLNRVFAVAPEPARVASRQGLGSRHRAGHPCAGGPLPKPLVAILWGRDARPVKPLLGDVPSSNPAPLAAFGLPRFLRLPAVQPGQRAAGGAGRRRYRLETPLAHPRRAAGRPGPAARGLGLPAPGPSASLAVSRRNENLTSRPTLPSGRNVERSTIVRENTARGRLETAPDGPVNVPSRLVNEA